MRHLRFRRSTGGILLPSPPPPPPNTDPLGVTAAGLNAIYAYRLGSMGPTSSITSRTGSDALPSGWANDTTDGGSKLFYAPVAGFNLSRWAFENGQILGRGTSSLTDFSMNNPGVTVNESTCHLIGNLGAETATYLRGNIDGTGMISWDGTPPTPDIPPHTGTARLGQAALVQVANGSSLYAAYCRFNHAPVVLVKGYDVTLDHFFAGTYLHTPYPGSGPVGERQHGEGFFMDGGVWKLLNGVFDSSTIDTDPGHLYTTAPIFLQTNGKNIDLTIDGFVGKGTSVQGGGQLSFFQVTCRTGYTVNITIKNTAIEKGSLSGFGGYFNIALQEDANSIHIVDGGNNYDLVTGSLVNHTYQ